MFLCKKDILFVFPKPSWELEVYLALMGHRPKVQCIHLPCGQHRIEFNNVVCKDTRTKSNEHVICEVFCSICCHYCYHGSIILNFCDQSFENDLKLKIGRHSEVFFLIMEVMVMDDD